MTNYSKNTNFTAKDALSSGNPLKKILGSGLDAEFDEIATAISSKEDSSNKNANSGYAGLDGSGLLPDARLSSNVPLKGSANTFTAAGNGFSPSSGISLFVETTDATTGGIRLRRNGSAGGYITPDSGGLSFSYDGLSSGGGIYVSSTGLSLYRGGTVAASMTTAGNVTVNAPSSGVALTSSGPAGNYAGVFNGNGTSGQSYGLAVQAGTTSADAAFKVTNAAVTQDRLTVFGDGGVTTGSPTGGNKGAGTANFAGPAYVNGEELGYRYLYERTVSGTDNTAATDNGRCVRYTSTGHTFTLDSDLPTNGVVNIRNNGTGNLTLAASGTLSWFNGSGTVPTGSRTVAVGGVVTATHMGSGNYHVWGAGLS